MQANPFLCFSPFPFPFSVLQSIALLNPSNTGSQFPRPVLVQPLGPLLLLTPWRLLHTTLGWRLCLLLSSSSPLVSPRRLSTLHPPVPFNLSPSTATPPLAALNPQSTASLTICSRCRPPAAPSNWTPSIWSRPLKTVYWPPRMQKRPALYPDGAISRKHL
ncbi:hypothetical protein GOP47_0017000 [Adiantum capillus-veneris]|uniref:Uncharacterized protein n=1 Tax=Adiantum capillus-veneris TaxID=13818 RepID=A0A9D4UIV4_ADICA|nr:hypothetical protein GOP47_0017000 [Adiantum capillus-veneris]